MRTKLLRLLVVIVPLIIQLAVLTAGSGAVDANTAGGGGASRLLFR